VTKYRQQPVFYQSRNCILHEIFVYVCSVTLNVYAMKKNMGSVDKTIRIIIALVIAILVFTDIISGTAGVVLLVLAAVFVLTSLMSFCPLYLPFGIKTCKCKE